MERSVNYTEAEIEPLKELRIKAREVTDEEKYLSDDNLIRALTDHNYADKVLAQLH